MRVHAVTGDADLRILSAVACGLFYSYSRAGSALMVDVCGTESHMRAMLHPREVKKRPIYGPREYVIDAKSCIRCIACYHSCPYLAIERSVEQFPSVVKLLCEGCGLCQDVCPVGAVSAKNRQAGWIATGRSDFGPVVFTIPPVGRSEEIRLALLLLKEANEQATQTGAATVVVNLGRYGCLRHHVAGLNELSEISASAFGPVLEPEAEAAECEGPARLERLSAAVSVALKT